MTHTSATQQSATRNDLPKPGTYTLTMAIKESQVRAQRVVGIAREIRAKLTGGEESTAHDGERMAGMIGDVDEIANDLALALDILAVVNEKLA